MTARRACECVAHALSHTTPGDACRSAAVSRTFLTAMEGDDVWEFPRELVALIFSHTTPQVVCRSFAVSHAFREVMKWDDVWEPLLPPDYREIVARAATPVEYASKMDLYFLLCGSILIDIGRKSFALDRPSGKKSFMLSVMELEFYWEGDLDPFREWVSQPKSRFPLVVELQAFRSLNISGRIHCRDLSQGTRYMAYFVFKLAEDSSGLDSPPPIGSLNVGAHTSGGVVSLQPEVSLTRGDGWMEIILGEFVNDNGDDGEVEMRLKMTGEHWKCGLIVEGIEVRPTGRQ